LIQTGKNYVYGTAAEKLEYNVYEENKVLKAKKQAKSSSKVKLRAVCFVLVIFASCLVLMYRFALITELNYNINKLEKEYNLIRNENSRLKLAIEKDMDLNKVKKIAEERLGMQKPDKYQMVYINVPKNDYTKVAESYKHTKDKANDNMFAVLLDKVSKFTRLLY